MKLRAGASARNVCNVAVFAVDSVLPRVLKRCFQTNHARIRLRVPGIFSKSDLEALPEVVNEFKVEELQPRSEVGIVRSRWIEVIVANFVGVFDVCVDGSDRDRSPDQFLERIDDVRLRVHGESGEHVAAKKVLKQQSDCEPK